MLTRHKSFVLICLSVLFVLNVYGIGDHRASRVLSSFTFKPPYFPDAGLSAIPGWDFRESTSIHDNHIRLTPGERNKKGIILNKRPFFLSSVELTLEFKIHSKKSLGGEGIALWLSDQPARAGSNLGGTKIWNGLMIAMDSHDNDKNGFQSMIAIHYNDGSAKYEKESDGQTTLLASCESDYRNPDTASFLHLYMENDKLNVFVDARGNGNWVRCTPEIQVKMPPRYFFSISASTGNFEDIHDVMSFRVNTMDEKLSLPDDTLNMNRPQDDIKSSQAAPDQIPEGKHFINMEVPSLEQKQQPEASKERNTVPVQTKEEPKKDNPNTKEEKPEIQEEEKQKEVKQPAAATTEKTPAKTQQEISDGVKAIIEDLKDQINELEREKKTQEAAAKEAKRLLEKRKADEEQRAKDWENKQSQLQEAQRIAQRLINEKEEENSKELARFSDCDEIISDCTNLREIFESLASITSELKESFGHELVEIQYQFAQKLSDIGNSLAPISSSSAIIKGDTAQAMLQLTQVQRVIEQLENMLEKKIGKNAGEKTDVAANAKFNAIVEGMTSLHKTLVQVQVEQQKLQERQSLLREKVKKSQPSNTITMIVALILGLQIVFQFIQWMTERNNRRRTRGGMLF